MAGSIRPPLWSTSTSVPSWRERNTHAAHRSGSEEINCAAKTHAHLALQRGNNMESGEARTRQHSKTAKAKGRRAGRNTESVQNQAYASVLSQNTGTNTVRYTRLNDPTDPDLDSL